MRVKINGIWYDAKEAAICVEMTDKDKENVHNMSPDSSMYAVFPDNDDRSAEEKLSWMTDTGPAALPGTPRDLHTIEQHVERAEQIAVRLWAYRGMRLLHCQNHATYEDQHDILQAVRNDLGALVSCIHALQKERANAEKA